VLALHRKTLRQSPDVGKRSLGDRVRQLRLELAGLELQQHQELAATIATAFASGEVFTAAGLWAQPEFRTQFRDADIRSVQQVGHWLHQAGFDRIGRDGDGMLWSVGANNLHDDPRILLDEP